MICPVCNKELKQDRKNHVIYCLFCDWYMEDCFDEDTINE